MDMGMKTPHTSLQNCPKLMGRGSVIHVSPRPPGDSAAPSSWRTTKVCQYSLKIDAKGKPPKYLLGLPIGKGARISQK